MKIVKFNTIRKRLTFWLLFLALIPLFISLVSTYIQRVEEINADSYNKLTTIRNLKVQQLTTWVYGRIGEVHIFAKGMELRNLEYVLFDDQPSSNDKQLILAAQKLITGNLFDFKDFSEISYINANTGIIEISTTHEFVGLNQKANLFYSEPLKNGKLFIKGIHHSDITNKHEMTLSTPVYGASYNKHIIGVLMVRVNLSNSLYALLNNRVGLGETGETLIVNSNAMALNELRWYDDAPLKLKIEAAPALAAVRGETGIIEDLDYRGELVLAAYTHIGETQWGFVCKQDMYEFKAPIRKMLRNFTTLFLLITLISVLLAFYIGKTIAKPIVDIHKVAQKIKEGDFSIRNTINTNDELGLLSQEFNKMADFTEAKIKIQQGVSKISETIISQTSMLSFGKAILKRLLKISEANMAVFYVLDEENGSYVHLTSIGANKELLKSFDSENLEGEFGNVLVNKEIHYLQNISENTQFTFNTTAGKVIPKEIITIPVLAENAVAAVISLVNIKKFENNFYEIIKQACLSVNTAYSSLLSNERTSMLAESLARMNNQLEAQSEELRCSTEELYDQNIELEKQKNKVEAANRLKSDFLSNMSHELRTPLNSINALSQVLIMQTENKLSLDEKDYLEIISRNGKRLLTLINDILDLSKIEAGKMDLILQPISIKSHLLIVKEIIQILAENKGISINFDVPDNIPMVESDETMLHQILTNISSNAVKFTPKGSITISARQENKNIIIKVEDTGIGISNENLPFIFNEFRQVDGSSSREYQGTGLGLAIASKAVHILGGKINVESTLGIGSVFTITIPIEYPKRKAISTFVKDKPTNYQHIQNSILIIDDDPLVANIILEYLLKEGYDSMIALNGAEALHKAEQYRPMAIILDIIMPEIDGWEVLQKIKSNVATMDIPVIIVSLLRDKATGFALGASGFINKPIDRDLLLKEMRKLHPSPNSVMIVDDNEFDLNEMKDVIENESIKTILAKSGKESIELLKETIPDVLVLDLMMPDMDGFQLLEYIRLTMFIKKLPIIIVTAKDLTLNDRKKLDGNISSIIVKSNTSLQTLCIDIISALNEIKGLDSNLLLNKFAAKTTILVVEDNADNMTIFKAILQNDYNLIEAYDGEEGLKIATERMPDLVLLDMSLPKLKGEEVASKLRENKKTKDIPIIAVSARAMKEDRVKFIKAGCNDFEAKPIDADTLKEKISNLLKL